MLDRERQGQREQQLRSDEAAEDEAAVLDQRIGRIAERPGTSCAVANPLPRGSATRKPPEGVRLALCLGADRLGSSRLGLVRQRLPGVERLEVAGAACQLLE